MRGRLVAGSRGDDELHLAHGTGAVHAFDGQLVIARLQRERQRQGPAHKRLSVQIASLELFHSLGNEFAPVLAAGLPAQMPAIGLPVLAYGERDRDMAGAGSRSRFSFAQHLHRRQRLFPSAPLESEQGCSDLFFAVRRHVHGFEQSAPGGIRGPVRIPPDVVVTRQYAVEFALVDQAELLMLFPWMWPD